jgi:radical SAM protein with 4Fe4S-binding SPASM domain
VDDAVRANRLPLIDPKEHYRRAVGPIEHEDLDEVPVDIRNIGWTLGNDCPYRCNHCYSMSAREKGVNFSVPIIERVVDQLARNGVETVNLGGNEPLFTNGPSPRDTLLPHIIRALAARDILVGLTTSGITLLHLERDHNDAFRLLNDVDVSLDSPFAEEHNANRGARLYGQALSALELCQEYDIEHSIIMCAMSWNFSSAHINALLDVAREYDANVRINPLKPVEPKHMDTALTAEQYYAGFSLLAANTSPVDLGEPPLATVMRYKGARGCPCGRTSFRIHSITPDGRIPVSPCVYLHDYKVGDLVTEELHNIVRSPQFRSFRRRNAHPEVIPGCKGCGLLDLCRGGCAGRSYLHHAHETGERSLFVRDPYCPREIAPTQPFPIDPQPPQDKRLVHMDYLCTWIGTPR